MFAAEPYQLPGWARALAIVVGAIAIGLAIVFFIDPDIALATFVFLAGLFLLAFGIERIAAGASGRSYRWVPSGVTPPTPGSPPRSGS